MACKWEGAEFDALPPAGRDGTDDLGLPEESDSRDFARAFSALSDARQTVGKP